MQALPNKAIIHKNKLLITDTLIIIQGQWCKSQPEGGEVVCVWACYKYAAPLGSQVIYAL